MRSQVRWFALCCVIGALHTAAVAAPVAPCDSSSVDSDWEVYAELGARASATLSWQPAPGAGFYDVHLGPTDPPSIWAEGVTGTSLTVDGLATGTRYYWYVVAHAECDSTLTSRSATQSLTTQGSCAPVGSFSLTSPAAGASGVSSLAILTWSAAPGAAGYDLYLGRSDPPTIALRNITGTTAEIPRLLPDTTYYWRVVARSACNATSSAQSAVQSFRVTAECEAPPPTSIAFVPSEVEVGQTYAITWEESEGIGAGGSYVVERSSSASFGSILDRQQTTSTSASFVPAGTGVLYHRVRAVAGCSDSRVSGWSMSPQISVVDRTANVIFTRPPEPVITRLGDRLEDERRTFTIENVGPKPVQVIVSRREVDSVPFFQIFDPLGENAAFFTLAPRQPKTLELRFSGPPNDVAGSYQGIITVTVVGQPVSVSPYAWINLKVGGGQSATPVFLVNGLESEYVAFPPKKGDDSDRPSISVDILNNGSTPMDVASEIGPELWLFPEARWNATPIPPNSFKPVRLSTLRFLAPNNSALPRYTYFTVRTRDGKAGRLLVQDNTAFDLGQGRPALSDPEARSFLVPTVTTETLGGGALRTSRLRITNLGGAAAQAELIYTPSGEDGFGANVRNAIVVIPPNDVVNLTDPLIQIFGLNRPATGQLEIRAAQEKIGLLTVTSSIETRLPGGGTLLEAIPILLRGEGARVGAPHLIAGLVRSPAFTTDLVLSETTGRDGSEVIVTLRDAAGTVRGTRNVSVSRYGRHILTDVIRALGGEIAGSGFSIELEVASGAGSVAGIAAMKAADGQGVSSVASRAGNAVAPVSSLGRSLEARTKSGQTHEDHVSGEIVINPLRVLAGSGDVYLVPIMTGGPLTPGPAGTTRTELSLANLGDEPASFDLTFTDDQSGNVRSVSETVGPRATKVVPNAVTRFGYPESTSVRGSLLVETGSMGRIFAQSYSVIANRTVAEPIPVVSASSETLTGSRSFKPLVGDGIEQSTDLSKGSRATLVLTEIAGESARVLVRLYEAGNRVSPIAEKEITVPAGSQVYLQPLFGALGLDSDERRKDRTNVQVVVIPTSSSGLVSAVLQTMDNRTGDTTFVALQPAGGVAATGIQNVRAETPELGRRRPVRRP